MQLNRISEVLAEAFAKVKFITDEYITSHEQEKKNQREKAKEHSKGQTKDHREGSKPNKNGPSNDKPNPKKEPVPAEPRVESKN